MMRLIECLKQRIIAYKTIRRLWQKLRPHIGLEWTVEAYDANREINKYEQEYPIISKLAQVFSLSSTIFNRRR